VGNPEEGRGGKERKRSQMGAERRINGVKQSGTCKLVVKPVMGPMRGWFGEKLMGHITKKRKGSTGQGKLSKKKRNHSRAEKQKNRA